MKLDAKEIRQRIRLMGLSEKQFAEKNGFAYPVFYMWLTGKHYPQFANIKKLAKALNCKIDDIEIDDAQPVMFGDADTTIKAFCAAVDHEMERRNELTKIVCMTKDCPFRAADGFYCNAKSITIENGQCKTQNGEFQIQQKGE